MPVEGVSEDVEVVVPVSDVAEPLPAAAALVIAPGPVATDPSIVVVFELSELLFGVDTPELIDAERDDVRMVCVNRIEIPLLPSADMLASGLQAVDGVVMASGLGGTSEVGLVGVCATAVEAHAMLIQMNKESFIPTSSTFLALWFNRDLVQATRQECSSLKIGRPWHVSSRLSHESRRCSICAPGKRTA